ncbi:hypothetical protein [Croceicoccus sp. YJ47]|uniref:hypothetical protein n=1 Tax=Croceicoccus sp. YJ47 TaxID=2798724 RepID=UPI0019212A26|nr:hypothetical protein [Croceicoccus sp. YJ47]QQN74244.1 hypothetical protein JD971_16300 [Croceicoccus sp. YJ47]
MRDEQLQVRHRGGGEDIADHGIGACKQQEEDRAPGERHRDMQNDGPCARAIAWQKPHRMGKIDRHAKRRHCRKDAEPHEPVSGMIEIMTREQCDAAYRGEEQQHREHPGIEDQDEGI